MTRVLIVDDFADARDLLSGYLASRGYDTEEAIDGNDALTRAFEDPPDIVLMDIAMPVMDGVEATEQLKRDPRTAHIPVIAVTGQTRAPESVCPPCDSVMVKPVDPIRVEEEIRRVLASRVPPAEALTKARAAGARARRAAAKDVMGREILWLFVVRASVREAITHLMQRNGYAVKPFASVEAAFEEAIDALPDAVAIDLAFPEDDAVELALALREQPELAHVVIIGLRDEDVPVPAELEPIFDACVEKSDGILELPTITRRLIKDLKAARPSAHARCATGDRVCTRSHPEPFGTVLDARAEFILLDVPLRGAFVVPMAAVESAENGRVVLDGGALDEELRNWLGEDISAQA